MDYAAVLHNLYARTNQGIKLGLDAVETILTALGEPQNTMPNVVIAGTNGKGFTSSLLAAALTASGYRVGLFTSPHLLRFTERIRIGGSEIDAAQVIALYAQITAAEDACVRRGTCRRLTFFECATVMALLAFAEQRVDVAVLEVGLGGRLDATNAVRKTLSVITAIDFDHQAYLGDTIAAIAREKAGIIAPEGLVVVGEQEHTEARETIQRIAKEQNATVIMVDPMAHTQFTHTPRSHYQQQGVATVWTACQALQQRGITCTHAAMQKALMGFSWTGRYDWYAADAKADLPGILYDGAHNPAGMRALLQSIALDTRFAQQPIHGVFSALADKPADDLLSMLMARAQSVHVCPVSSQRSRTTEQLTALAQNCGSPENTLCSWEVHSTPKEALQQACTQAKKTGGIVLVTGSLFLIADVMAVHLQQPRDPAVDG